MTDGIICIDKPKDFTSFDVVAKVRGILHERKVGHGGTLDPLATGVLPVFVGRATKAMDIMPAEKKRYRASFKLGFITDTQDIMGKVLETRPVNVTCQQLKETAESFLGESMQLPPMYSAISVGGKRLYDLARQGIEVEREKRPIKVFAVELSEYNEEMHEGVLDVTCSKGTYIRTILFDIGEKLGCGCTMTDLRRTETLGFKIEECVTLEELAELVKDGRLDEKMLPVSEAFKDYRRIDLNDNFARLYLNGIRLTKERLHMTETEGLFTVWNRDIFLSVAGFNEEGELVSKKIFTTADMWKERLNALNN